MTTPRLVAALAAFVMLASPWAGAEEKAGEKAKDKPKPRTYTDEDLKKYKAPPPTAPPSETGAASGEAPSTTGRPKRSREHGGYQELPPERPEPDAPSENAPGAEPAADEGPGLPERSPEEVEWRGRARQARQPLDQARGRIAGIDAEIAALRDRLNPMSTNYVLGGNSTAGPGQVYEIEDKLRSLDDDKKQAQAELAEAEKAWERFLDEARAAGAAPGWLAP